MTSRITEPTIRALLDVFAHSWIVRTIEDTFVDAGIVPTNDAPVGTSARRNAALQFLDGLDLESPRDTTRLLKVFDTVLGDLNGYDGVPDPELQRIVVRLQADGFTRANDGKLRPTTAFPLDAMSQPLLGIEVLREHIQRLEANLDGDPAVVIGSSKELIESTCKVVLERTDTPYKPNDNVPTLVKQAQQALGLHPEMIAPTAPAQASVKRLLGALASLAVGVAELRNELGAGHGREHVVVLPHRHAHLAAGSAITFARMFLETLEDQHAPWRKPKVGETTSPHTL